MASNTDSNHGNKDVEVDVRELFNLLDSPNIADVDEIKELVQQKLDSTKETWLLSSLMDYYYITSSKEAIDILINVKEPHDKYLVDKITDGIRIVGHRLKAVQLLLNVACKQPIWIHKIVTQSAFSALLKCLKSESDVPILMTGVMCLTILLPSIPTYLGHHLSVIFEVFSHLIAFSYKKPGSPTVKGVTGNVPEVFVLHLQVALYSLFHRLYGMFPYNFLTYLRHHFAKKENLKVYHEVVKPMLERVRLHPQLITGNRDTEISSQRWRNMESQDVVISCAKMSLDVMEGMWEEPSETMQNNILNKPLDNLKTRPPPLQTKDNSMLRVPEPVPFNNYQSDTYFSPSMAIGMSTPPPSQRNTPATSILETSATLAHSGTHGNTPVLTPRATPPIFDEEKGLSRNSSKGSLFTRGSDKKMNISLTIQQPKVNEAKSSAAIPQSPVKPEFTAEPPFGAFRSLPTKTTARELKFDVINDPVPESPAPSFSDSVMMHPYGSKEDNRDPLKDDNCDVLKGNHTNGLKGDNLDVPRADKEYRVDVEDSHHQELMDSFSMDTFPKMMEHLNNSDEDSASDDEVSEITRHHRSSEAAVTLTAESVAQFMKSVNRIRFNSLTATNTMDIYKQERIKKRKSRSCPSLPKVLSIESDEGNDDTDSDSIPLSRSMSTTSQYRQASISSQNDQSSVLPVVTTITVDTTTNTQTTSHISITSCPIFSPQGNPSQPANTFIDIIKKSLVPNSVQLCQRCKSCLINNDTEIPLFQAHSPLELLDKHLTMGREIHAKELSKIPITSQETINWTHFGGAPPADEINILRGQIIMIENQLMYERHKRDLLNRRNRRLLRKITNAETLEENNKTMAEQINMLETEIQNFKVSTKLLQDENRKLKDSQESNEYEMLVKLRSCLQENSDLKSTKTELNTLLVRQREEQDALKKKLQEAENHLFHHQEEIVHLKQQEELASKLKDQVLHIHKELMLMGELNQKFQESLNINKHRKNKQPEHEMLVASLKTEIQDLQAQRDRDSFQLTACQNRVIELEENVKIKDVCVTELKKKLEDVKVSQEDELKAVDDKYCSVIKINQALEGKLLQLYSQVDELRHPKQDRKGLVASPLLPPFQTIQEESINRGRTESDPPLHAAVAKPTVCKVPSVPADCNLNETLTESQSENDRNAIRDIDETSIISKESGIEP